MTLAHAHAAFSQAWPAFALVVGLLLIGASAASENLFKAVGALAARLPGGAVPLLVALLCAEAAVTAVLNLDTAVVFMTPVLLHSARHRGLAEGPFLYGAVFMANSASLLLPGANLTNLIVLSGEHVSGLTFASHLALPWLVAVSITLAFVLVAFRRVLGHGSGGAEPFVFRPRAGTVGVLVAVALVLMLSRPGLPVLALGIAVAVAARLRARAIVAAANPLLLGGVLAVAVLLGTAARAIGGLERLMSHAGRWETAWLGAGASVVVNNLPAAVVLSAHAPAHPRALLLGLDLGPNLAVTGSLSAVLWFQVARSLGARPSARLYTLFGLALVPLTLCGALLATGV
jgi:arsenical pump membrane protein